MAEPGRWRLYGVDTFAREEYFIAEYGTREEVMAAARAQLAHIERTQPRETAGELQDDIAIVSPDGESIALDPA